MSSESGFIREILEDDSDSVTSDHAQQPSLGCVVQEDNKPLETFTCFPRLPPELRLRIWKAALPGPRVMRVRAKYETVQTHIGGKYKELRISRFVASHPPPIGLRVCRESRHEALKHYELAFLHKTTDAQTYVNYQLDTLVLDTLANYFPHSGRGKMNKGKEVLLCKEFGKVRSIVIDERCVWLNRRLFLHRDFPSLQTISVIMFRSSTKAFKKRSWDIEECDAPKEPERDHETVEWVEDWLREMKRLNRAKLEIRFVRVIEGSSRKEARDRKADAKGVAKSG